MWSALIAVDDALAAEWWTVNQARLTRVKALLGQALGVIREAQGELDPATPGVWEVIERPGDLDVDNRRDAWTRRPS